MAERLTGAWLGRHKAALASCVSCDLRKMIGDASSGLVKRII